MASFGRLRDPGLMYSDCQAHRAAQMGNLDSAQGHSRRRVVHLPLPPVHDHAVMTGGAAQHVRSYYIGSAAIKPWLRDRAKVEVQCRVEKSESCRRYCGDITRVL